MIKRYERVSLKANKYSLSVQMLLSYDQTKKLILIVIKYFLYVRIYIIVIMLKITLFSTNSKFLKIVM